MKKISPLIAIFCLVILIGFAGVSAAPGNKLQVVVNTANTTEFNTTTPKISVTTTGNSSTFLCNVTIGGTIVVSDSNISNATATKITATTASTSRTLHNESYVTCWWNGSVAISNRSVGNLTFQINGRPEISAVTQSPAGVTPKGGNTTWTVTWSDQNATTTDDVLIYICKTNAFASGTCTGGQYCNTTTYEHDNSSSCTYDWPATEVSGPKTVYAFAIDNNYYPVASGTSDAMDLGGSSYKGPTAIKEGVTKVTDAKDWVSKYWWILALVVVAAMIFMFTGKKKR